MGCILFLPSRVSEASSDARRRLVATRRRLLATRHSLLATRRRLLATRRSLLGTRRCLLFHQLQVGEGTFAWQWCCNRAVWLLQVCYKAAENVQRYDCDAVASARRRRTFAAHICGAHLR